MIVRRPWSGRESDARKQGRGERRGTPRLPVVKTIDGPPVSIQTEVTTWAQVVQCDPALHAPDPLAFRPERWLAATPSQLAAMDATQRGFGAGPRACLGRRIAFMELGKQLRELVRRFIMELRSPGRYIVAGGVAHNQGFRVRLRRRTSEGNSAPSGIPSRNRGVPKNGPLGC